MLIAVTEKVVGFQGCGIMLLEANMSHSFLHIYIHIHTHTYIPVIQYLSVGG